MHTRSWARLCGPGPGMRIGVVLQTWGGVVGGLGFEIKTNLGARGAWLSRQLRRGW